MNSAGAPDGQVRVVTNRKVHNVLCLLLDYSSTTSPGTGRVVKHAPMRKSVICTRISPCAGSELKRALFPHRDVC